MSFLPRSFAGVRAANALLPLRLIIGFGFFAHGLAKWNRGPEKFGALLVHIGIPFPFVMGWVGTTVELLGGAALLVGLAVSIACVPLIFSMLVAMFSIHIRYGFSSINTVGLTSAGPQFGPPGYEINLLYIAGLLALALGGPTIFSIDRMLADRRLSRRSSVSFR